MAPDGREEGDQPGDRRGARPGQGEGRTPLRIRIFEALIVPPVALDWCVYKLFAGWVFICSHLCRVEVELERGFTLKLALPEDDCPCPVCRERRARKESRK